MTIAVLGIDLGKNSCSVVGLDKAGSVVVRRRMRRESTHQRPEFFEASSFQGSDHVLLLFQHNVTPVRHHTMPVEAGTHIISSICEFEF